MTFAIIHGVMKKIIDGVLTSLVIVTLIVLSLIFNPFTLSDNKKDTLLILLIVCGAAALYCFVVGEISRNNSQMDKLWSILPIAYTWIIAIKA
jgi:steroid 5-alpha reductase family enzyme